ncbi:hypothetical protein RHGRI_012172 [Rhododendron griersonianum]|uniref:Uncharacterized protein n=1 Tax=Rhododendron griersonianum TaxID=479676 RepID=A0AAV6KQX5_9ERIC|nr:hypothetical protein RHGRI_012172 [Rhododendron griersonianum]
MEFQVVWDFTDDDPVGGVLLRRSLCISIADLFMHRLIKQSFDALNSSDHGGTDLDELISNCIRTFKTDKRYQNDVRTPVTKLQSFDPLFLSACFSVHIFRDLKKRPAEESDAYSSRETSSDGGSECGAERGTNHAQGAWSQHNNMRAIAQSFNRLSVDKGEISDPPGFLLFEYFDSAPPFSREPLADKASRFLFPRKFACFSLNALLPS